MDRGGTHIATRQNTITNRVSGDANPDTNVRRREKPKPGRTVLSVDVDGKSHVICTLIAEKFEMQPLDLMFGAAQEVRASLARPL